MPLIIARLQQFVHHIIPVPDVGGFRQRGQIIFARRILIVHFLINQFGQLLSVQQRYIMGNIFDAGEGIIIELHLSGFTPFCGDQNNAIGPTGTIDGTWCGIFQNLNAGNIIFIRHSSADHPIHDIERIGSVNGSNATDTDSAIGYLHSRHGALKRSNCTTRYFHQIFGVHNSDGRGQIDLLLFTIAYHHNFIHGNFCGNKWNTDFRRITDYIFCLIITHIGYNKDFSRIEFEYKFAFLVCWSTEGFILHFDRCPNNWFSLITDDLSMNHFFLSRQSSNAH